MVLAGTPDTDESRPIIPQTAGWLGVVDGHLLLVRQYADGSTTAAVSDGVRYGLEVELKAEELPC